MRRRVTLRTTLYVLLAAPSLLTAALPVRAAEDPFISVVTGLAPDDLLNIRAKPSATGKTEARVAAGASVRNLGCNDIDGHPWCKVQSDNPKATGWAPARYLIPVNPATVSDTDQPADAVAAVPDAGQAPDGAAPAPPATPPAARPPAMPPPDLTARLGGTDHAADPGTTPESAATTAMQDAYGLALAANAAQAPDTQIVAELPPPQGPLAAGAAIQIPCAREVGQPMTHCAASVARKDADKVDITVTWPEGGTRVISFSGGLPSGSNADGDFRYTREGSLSMIRVGISERFEITDAVAFGK
ncbi:SH3 domain-containing protein [Mesorhizobium sp. M00.F.Ca.ET.186.01.1.1]|nr:SH3 domain-containing protein [bacterium M00.F.Ca.ET.205.01.1.1]TGU55269.1 SH3 domain-containing protein [bacterium M00.F.Ca.ET.152.01.1.1]TGV40613.1 SH3 domain-containing protein [Mesorhizobium sp. M00.F.Ca.ET.186.01.1.1]TGZ45437.1 SH3 domain-containing protein [bacterium M00.F.Ca.ET.162.01.1.1]